MESASTRYCRPSSKLLPSLLLVAVVFAVVPRLDLGGSEDEEHQIGEEEDAGGYQEDGLPLGDRFLKQETRRVPSMKHERLMRLSTLLCMQCAYNTKVLLRLNTLLCMQCSCHRIFTLLISSI